MNEIAMRGRISKIICDNNIDTAINRLQGYMGLYYGHPFLCEKLAGLYVANEDFLYAGKYTFYKGHLSDQDNEILSVYFQSFGTDYTVILRDLVAIRTRSPLYICDEAKVRIFIMMNKVRDESGFLPKFMWNWYYHFESKLKKDKRYGQLSQLTRR